MNRTVETMIHAIRKMRPRLDSRAREIEAARRVPTDILDELQRLGVLRMNAPRSHGGLELPLRESCAVVVEGHRPKPRRCNGACAISMRQLNMSVSTHGTA